MLDTLTPIAHDAAMAGLGAAGTALIAAILPYLNRALDKIRPDAKTVAQILTMMDMLLQGRADLTIGDIEILPIAKQAALRLSETDGLTEDRVTSLATKAAEKWSVEIFQRKLGGGTA